MKTTEENNKLIAEFMANSKVETHHNQYHTSWNELMPVIRKIKDIDPKFQIKHLGAFSSWEHRFKESLYMGIGNTYGTVVEFIKWYNQLKTNNQ